MKIVMEDIDASTICDSVVSFYSLFNYLVPIAHLNFQYYVLVVFTSGGMSPTSSHERH